MYKQLNFKHVAKHRTGSENARGSPQEACVFVVRPKVGVFLQPEAYLTLLFIHLLMFTHI